MIVKKRTKPRKIYFNEAILRRIPANHPKIPIIVADIGNKEAGHKGEESLDFYLGYLPEKDYYIFQGLRLPNGKSHFQIDSLIMGPTYLLTTEAKNMKGELEFDEKNDQLIQKTENKQKGYDDPLLQAQFQVRQLKEFLRKHQFPAIPVEYLVMMSNSSAVLKTAPDSEARYRVCRGRRLVYRIEEFTNRYQEEKLNREQLRKLCSLLLKYDTEPSYDIKKSYGISRSEILTGVHCPTCGFLGMTYSRGSWLCPKCGEKSKDAHLQALKDYYLLFGPTITNQQFREFLHLPSVNIASKILTKLNLPYSGKKRHRVYQLSFKDFT